jgi:hypothetical protein
MLPTVRRRGICVVSQFVDSTFGPAEFSRPRSTKLGFVPGLAFANSVTITADRGVVLSLDLRR